jgi:uncharacterized protein YcnI
MRRDRIVKVCWAILLTLTIFGCSATVKEAAIKQTLDIPSGKETKPIQFKKVVVKLARGTTISLR